MGWYEDFVNRFLPYNDQYKRLGLSQAMWGQIPAKHRSEVDYLSGAIAAQNQTDAGGANDAAIRKFLGLSERTPWPESGGKTLRNAVDLSTRETNPFWVVGDKQREDFVRRYGKNGYVGRFTPLPDY